MSFSDEQVQQFKKTGLLVVPGFFTPDEIADVSDLVDHLAAKDAGPGEEAHYYETSPLNGEDILVRTEHFLGDLNPDLDRILVGDKTKGALTRLLGEAPLLFKEKVNFKLPGCRPDKLHQDQAAGWGAYANYFVSMAVVVDENTLENGAISFMKSGNYPKDRLMSPEWEPITHDDPPYQPEDEYLLALAKPGDVIFFDSFVPHGSPSNGSDKQRRNIFLTFNKASDGDHRMSYYRDKWVNYAPNQKNQARKDSSFRV